jgi:phage gp37-like protein
LVPLACAAGLFIAPIVDFYHLDQTQVTNSVALRWVGGLIAGWSAALALIVVAIVQMVKVSKANRRLKYGPPLAEIQAAQARDAAWRASVDLYRSLLRREVPPGIRVWDVVSGPEEVFLFETPAVYARYYGSDVTYTTRGGFYFGHPAFVVTGLAVSAIANASARSRAEAMARAQWRERQVCRTLVSNQRIVCLAGGQQLSFYFNSMIAVYPEIDQSTLICQFDGASPLMLTGDAAPMIAIVAVLQTHGMQALEEHPGLARLRSVPAPPDDGLGGSDGKALSGS